MLSWICAVVNYREILVDFNNLVLGAYGPLYYLGGSLGSVGVMLFFKWLEPKKVVESLCYVGRNSLVIMGTHLTLGVVAILKSGYMSTIAWSGNWGPRYFLESIIVFLLVMLTEVGIVEVFRRVFPFLTGKGSKKSVEINGFHR